MAGDWIKMRTDLADDPAVISIALKTRLDEYSVVGKLHKLWSWADRHCSAVGNAPGVTSSLPFDGFGNAPGVTVSWIDRFVGTDGFGVAMCEAGWLTEVDNGVQFPRFDRHNLQTAKDRALTAKRVASHKRKGNAVGNARTVTSTVTIALPTEEKRREESNTPKPPFDSAGYEHAFAEFWEAYPLDRDGKKLDIDDCRVKFAHVPPHQWWDVVRAARNYSAGSSAADGYVMHPAKFLLGKWANWTEPAKPSSGSGVSAPNKLASLDELKAMNDRAREISERHKRKPAVQP